MKTVTFGNKNSYADFGLILNKKEIGKPEPRTNYIDVPARDGHLDLTEAFGEVKYKERKLVFYFSYIGSDANWENTLSALHNYLNGQRHKIYFEANYYWVGRCFVGDAQTKRGIKEFTVECDCEPYKYRLEDTIVETRRNNLLNIDKGLNDVFVKNDDGSYTITKTSTGRFSARIPIELKAGKTYSFSYELLDTNTTYWAGIQFAFSNEQALAMLIDKPIQTYTPTTDITYLTIYQETKTDAGTYTTFKNLQIEEGANATAYKPYDTDIKTILNDRKTVTPKITAISGEPILSWTDKKTGISYQNALPSDFDNKILDFKFYEGNNTFEVKGGDIRLTYREASL